MRAAFLVLHQDAHEVKSHGFSLLSQFVLIVPAFVDDCLRGRCSFAGDVKESSFSAFLLRALDEQYKRALHRSKASK